MNLEERKEFDRLKETALWFGKTFLASKGGAVWAEATKLSGTYYVPWFDFYWGIIIEDFEYLCNKLFKHKPEGYDKQALSEELSGIIEELKSLDIPPAQPETSELRKQWERITVTPRFLENRKKKLNSLFDHDIIYTAPWNDPNRNKPDWNPDIIISADNRLYKHLLLVSYTNLIEKLQAPPESPEKPAPDTNSELLKQNQRLQEEVSALNKELRQAIEKTKKASSLAQNTTQKQALKRLEKEIETLKKHSSQPKNEQTEDAGSRENMVYRMVLLHHLGFLDKKHWPESATQDQISKVLAAILGSPQDPAKGSTVKRYLKALVNRDYDGQKIQEKYGSLVEEFLEKNFREK